MFIRTAKKGTATDIQILDGYQCPAAKAKFKRSA